MSRPEMLPATKEYITEIKKMAAENPVSLSEVSIEDYRAMCSGYSEQSGEMATDISYTETEIPVADGVNLRTKIFSAESDTAETQPALIWIPGGGFIAYLEGCHDSACSIMAKEAGCKVILIEPRLAPEYKAPTPLNDVYAAVDYVFTHADELNIDPDNIALGGDSSGANLSLGTAIRRRDANLPELKQLVLISGTYDLTLSVRTEELRSYEKEDFMTDDSFEYMFQHYVPEDMERNDPRVSPYFADLQALPPVLMIVAEFDAVRSQTPALESKLNGAGVSCRSITVAGQTHSFLILRGVMGDGEDPAVLAGEELKSVFPQPGCTHTFS